MWPMWKSMYTYSMKNMFYIQNKIISNWCRNIFVEYHHSCYINVSNIIMYEHCRRQWMCHWQTYWHIHLWEKELWREHFLWREDTMILLMAPLSFGNSSLASLLVILFEPIHHYHHHHHHLHHVYSWSPILINRTCNCSAPLSFAMSCFFLHYQSDL